MNTIVLLAIIFLAQIGFTIYSLVTGSKQEKYKLIMRLVSLNLIIVLIVTRVIDWDYRWKPIAVALTILVLISFVSWLRKSKSRENKGFSRWKAVLSGLVSLLFILLSASPLLIFPMKPIPEPTGKYKVLTSDVYYTDKNRVEENSEKEEFREVNLTFWYPDTDSGKYPLVIFDHGFNGVKLSNESTFKELASHGYVVCSMDHPYQSMFTTRKNGKTVYISPDFMKEYGELGKDLGKNLDYLNKWTKVRIDDTNFVIDEIVRKNEGFYRLIDKSKIGTMGHSLGAVTATAMPRFRDDIDSVVNLEGPMPYEITGVQSATYSTRSEKYPVPILFMYTEYLYDIGIKAGVKEGDPLYLVSSKVAKSADEGYEIVFKGAQHADLTDLPFISPLLARMISGGRKSEVDNMEFIKTMNKIILEYFDSTLKNSGEFPYGKLTIK